MRKHDATPSPLSTVRQAAEYTGTTKQNIWRLIKSGKLRIVPGSAPAVVARVALEAYLAQKGQSPRRGGRPKGERAREILEIRQVARSSLLSHLNQYLGFSNENSE